MPRKKTLEEVLSDFRKAHGDRYDYSLVEYKNSNTFVSVKCRFHGVFKVTPAHHKNGVGCRDCYFESQKTTKAEFIENSRKHFNNRFDYSLFEKLPPFGEKVQIRCIEHDEVFLQEPRNHQRGHVGCEKCKSQILSSRGLGSEEILTTKQMTENFVARAHEVHGNDYDYSKFVYISSTTNGTIICPTHGEFPQCPNNHLKGNCCPSCATERLKQGTFKHKCEELGIDYWRALKRRDAGLSEEKIFEESYIRSSRETTPVTVHNKTYPNVKEAARILESPASSKTIARWLVEGVPPEEAFQRVPNPGYGDGIVYKVTHLASGKPYVGITVQSLERRWESHIEQAGAGHIRSEDSLHAAIRSFGPEAFKYEQIDVGQSKFDLEEKERFWIKKLKTLSPYGYNISTGGTSGGSNAKPVIVDGQNFPSVKSATEYIARTRKISLHAAKKRLQTGRIDVRTPAAKGKSLVKTQAYKAWSRIVHCVVNPKSKSYIPNVDLYEPWRDFVTFLDDVGQPPDKGMAFVRINKAEGFFPNNCAWVTRSEASKINAAQMFKKADSSSRDNK